MLQLRQRAFPRIQSSPLKVPILYTFYPEFSVIMALGMTYFPLILDYTFRYRNVLHSVHKQDNMK